MTDYVEVVDVADSGLDTRTYSSILTAILLEEKFSFLLVCQVEGLDFEEAERLRETLVEEGYLTSRSGAYELNRERAESLLEVADEFEMRATHTRIARTLHLLAESEHEIASHLCRGFPTPEDWAKDILRRAAHASMQAGKFDRATEYLRWVHSSSLAAPDYEVLIELGICEAALGHDSAMQRFELAVKHIESVEGKLQALYHIGQTLYTYGKHGDAQRTFQTGHALAQRNSYVLYTGLFDAAILCPSQFVVESRPGLRKKLNRHQELWDDIPRTHAEKIIQANLAIDAALSLRGAPVERIARAAKHAVDFRSNVETLLPDDMSDILAVLALVWSDQLDDALRYSNQIVDRAGLGGSIHLQAESLMVRGMVHHVRGDLRAAIQDSESASSMTGTNWGSASPTPFSILVSSLLEKNGRNSTARLMLNTSHSLPIEYESRGMNAWYLQARGHLHLVEDDADAALGDFLAAGESFNEYLDPVNPAVIPWRSLGAIAASRAGKRDVAESLLAEQLELADGAGLYSARANALRVMSQLFSPTEQFEYLAEAIEIQSRVGAQLELTKSQHLYGRRLLERGDLEEGRDYLKLALENANACDATRLKTALIAELRESGARPRRVATSGVEALTPAESAILDELVRGQTSKAISEQLFLSVHTVNWHITKIYRKFGVRTRKDLMKSYAELSVRDDAESPTAM